MASAPPACPLFPNGIGSELTPPQTRTSALHFIFDTHHPMDGYPPNPPTHPPNPPPTHPRHTPTHTHTPTPTHAHPARMHL